MLELALVSLLRIWSGKSFEVCVECFDYPFHDLEWNAKRGVGDRTVRSILGAFLCVWVFCAPKDYFSFFPQIVLGGYLVCVCIRIISINLHICTLGTARISVLLWLVFVFCACGCGSFVYSGHSGLSLYWLHLVSISISISMSRRSRSSNPGASVFGVGRGFGCAVGYVTCSLIYATGGVIGCGGLFLFSGPGACVSAQLCCIVFWMCKPWSIHVPGHDWLMIHAAMLCS